MSIYAFGFLSSLFYLCLTKCNTKFVFFCFILLFYFFTLFIKEEKLIFFLKKETIAIIIFEDIFGFDINRNFIFNY